MKIANQETIKSIVEPEDKPGAVESAKVRENTSLGIASVKSRFENAAKPNTAETMIAQNQAETLKPKSALDQVLHWLNRMK
jgi:hypothetical protein